MTLISLTRRRYTIVDFASNNLHVVQYSQPVDTVMPLAELRLHLHTHPISRTGYPMYPYYTDNWGFLSHPSPAVEFSRWAVSGRDRLRFDTGTPQLRRAV